MNECHLPSMERLKNYILELNLFSRPPLPNIEESNYQHHTDRIATRVFLILLFFILFIFLLATVLIPQPVEVIVQRPSKIEFESLPTDAICPCSQVSLSYSKFLFSHPSFHQVCSSDFVSLRWISSLYFDGELKSFRNGDFRATAFAFFQILASFCRLSNSIVNQSLARLNSDVFISSYAVSSNNLNAQAFAYVEQFQFDAPKSFQTQIQLMNSFFLGSLFLNGLQTGILPIVYWYLDQETTIFSSRRTPNSLKQEDGTLCNCFASFSCEGYTSSIYSTNISIADPMVVIPGLRQSCMPLDACLHSTLECFFNQSCVDTITSFLLTNLSFAALIEPISNNQKWFRKNSTIESIIGQLMIEDWNFNVVYEAYFDQCAPFSCTYLLMAHPGFFSVIGTLLHLIAGLCTVTSIAVSMAVRLIRKRQQKKTEIIIIQPEPYLSRKLC